MTPKGLALFAVGVGLVVACGRAESEPANDAGSDASAAGPLDASATKDSSVEPLDAAMARCVGATYTSAPSGAACEPRRIVRSGSFEPACWGPAIGAYCDRLEVSVTATEAPLLPAGFTCRPAELGVRTCEWSFADDASTHALDAAALDAACAVTTALPDATVTCATHGS